MIARVPASSSWSIWLSGIRPKTLVAGAAPVLVGASAAWASGHFRPLAAALALIGALCLQAGANLANDAGDGAAGVDGAQRVGPARLVQSGLATARQVWLATAVTFLLATLAGVGLVVLAGWPILAIGIAAMIAAVGYTVGPAPLARLGLGETSAFVFFGPVAVLGTYAAATGSWQHLPIVWGLPTGLLAAALMLANNLRDRETDAAVGKRTLAVRLGAIRARQLYRTCVLGAQAVPIVVGARHGEFLVVAAGVVLTPWVMRALAAVQPGAAGRQLAPALGRIADLLVATSVSLTLGLVLTGQF